MSAKYQTITEDLREQILNGEYRTASVLPSEFELMQRYQVSRQTIRHALSTLEDEGLINKRRGSGSYIQHTPERDTSHLKTIAVVTTYISDYIFPGILRDVETVFAGNNCTPTLFATHNQVSTERTVLQNLLNMPIHGLLVEGTKTALPNPNLDLYRQLTDEGVPIVFINGSYARLNDTVSVLDDNVGGGEMLVDYLVSKGHKKIAGIFKSDDIQGQGRYEGYSMGLLRSGLMIEDDFTLWYTTEQRGRLFRRGISEQTLRMWLDNGCTAIVCYNDEIALSLITFLNSLNIRVPEDLAVVSFDNSPLSEYGPIPITSLSHGDHSVGRIAADKLLQLMNGREVSSELVPWTLIQRASG